MTKVIQAVVTNSRNNNKDFSHKFKNKNKFKPFKNDCKASVKCHHCGKR